MVVGNLSQAIELVRSGSNVVLVVPEEIDLGLLPDGPGRLAVMVGDPGAPATWAAAESMAADLFGRAR